MTPIQQMLLGVGASKKTYMDDVFSTYLFRGNATSRSITNGIDLTKGGMTWIKNRDATSGQDIFDTVRGTGKRLTAESTAGQSNASSCVNAFNSNGFGLGTDSMTNTNDEDYASWTWRKEPGFFDVVTWTGNGSNRTISHSLGSVPGIIIVKNTSSTNDWAVYHRSLGATKYIRLNASDTSGTGSTYWNNTEPTATAFSIGTHVRVNNDGDTHVAYLFAGGESTAATASSVDFDGTGDYLTAGSSSDFTMGTGDFTVECWVKADTYDDGIFQISNTSGGIDSSGYQSDISLWIHNNGRLGCSLNGSNTYGSTKITKGHWHHVAITRASGTAYIFLDGTLQFSGSEPTNYDGTYIAIGGYYSSSFLWDGQISNFRVVKGTAVYTSSFRPPTKPLTNITNTVLLCCNNSSTTGSTVTPGTITANGNPTASTDSPFDDPAAFTFGASKEGIIKCGSYVGDGSSDGSHEINVGWEPQWIIVKRTDSSASANWKQWDSMRGIVTGGSDADFEFNSNAAESSGDFLDLTPTGWKYNTNSNSVNGTNATYIYMAIRRPDGYVGKPADAGTDVFAMDTGNGSSIIPVFDSGFPVDFTVSRKPATAEDWAASARLIGPDYLAPNDTRAELEQDAVFLWDSNVGCYSHSSFDSTQMGWMWKRHAGFDVVTWVGTGNANTKIKHGLSKTPEMIWLKNRNRTCDWIVYHKELNGGTNPEQYYLSLNDSDAEATQTNFWQDTAPTSTAITVGSHDDVNSWNNNIVAMLFASVDGISKVGSYTGNGSSTARTISTGFAPRFLIIKQSSGGTNWWIVLDTTRGWSSGNDNWLGLNSSNAQGSYDLGEPTSTGFQINTDDSSVNQNNTTYIYYAHA